MKRLALVLAAAVLGTGCFVDDTTTTCPRTLTLGWTFMDADGFALATCGAAGVGAVDVWTNNVFLARFDCLAYSGTVSLAAGSNLVTVEGIDSLDRIAYRDEFIIDASACGSQGTIQTQPAEGWLAVDYTFAPVNACYAPGPTYIWLDVYDDIAAQTAFVDTGVTSAQQCSVTAAAPRYRVPMGSFTLLGIQEMLPVVGGYSVVGTDCTDRPFDIGGGAVTTVSPVLFDSAAACF